MKVWQPHVDLHQLTVALSEEIIAAPEQELRRLHAESGYSIAAAAQDVRGLIAAASGEPDAGHTARWRTAVAHIYAS
jgi:hypothetical protein